MKIGIIGAMEIEVVKLRDQLTDKVEITKGDLISLQEI